MLEIFQLLLNVEYYKKLLFQQSLIIIQKTMLQLPKDPLQINENQPIYHEGNSNFLSQDKNFVSGRRLLKKQNDSTCNFGLIFVGKILIILLFLIWGLYYFWFRASQPISQNQQFRYSYNLDLIGQTFGKSADLYININEINLKDLKEKSKQKPYYYSKIQVGSVLDFGLTQLIDFNMVQKKMEQKLSYQLITFAFNESLQKKPTKLDIENFNNSQQIEEFLDSLQFNSQQKQKGLEYNLAFELIKNKNDKKILEAEYYHANKKYNIENQQKQLPICVYTSEHNILGKQDRYLKYFEQIENLNYTNFHILYIDDFSTDGSFEKIYQLVKNSSMRIKNRIKIIHTLQQMGVLANMNFWIKKYCGNDDIVVMIDGDDRIIGRQGFKILNSIYSASHVWYAYSKFILTRADEINFESGAASTFLNEKTSVYRSSFKWQTSIIRTFRKSLFDSIPLSSLIQYHYDEEKNIAWPAFYKYASDMFIIYTLLQMAGNHRIVHIQQYLYLYYYFDHVNHDCYREHQIYDGFKANIKTPLKLLGKLGDASNMTKKYQVSQEKLNRVKQAYENLLKCEQRMKVKDKQVK